MSPRATLAVDQMTDAQLWSGVRRELLILSTPFLGTYTIPERRQKATLALVMFDELALRGEQLRFLV